MLRLTLVTCASVLRIPGALVAADHRSVAIGVASVAVVWVLVGFERDVVLSRLHHTTPGSIDFNWALIQRVAIYGVLPLIAVVGALFPEVAGSARVAGPVEETRDLLSPAW
jgi:hypothetical protein